VLIFKGLKKLIGKIFSYSVLTPKPIEFLTFITRF
jgi:hypothetical protein